MRLILACICFGLGVSPIPSSAGATNPPSLTGSWQLTLTPVNPTTVVPTHIASLATFTSDGNVIETNATEIVPTILEGQAVYGTPGHGIWQPGPAISNLFVQLVSLLVNQNGTLHARKITTITGSLDSTGSHFTGTYSFELVNPAGTVIGTGSGRVTGQLIPHPLLP